MAAAELLPREDDGEIVSSNELNFVKFITQPSIFLNSFSSVTFCQETFNVVDETASTITSSGCPGRVFIPSATPVPRSCSRCSRYDQYYVRKCRFE